MTSLAATPLVRLAVLVLAVLLPAAGGAGADTPLRVGMVAYVGEATGFYALEEGYFADEGLDLEVTVNPSGLVSLRQLLAGDLDLCTVEPTPVVLAALDRLGAAPPFRIVASLLQTSDMTKLIAVDGDKTPTIRDLPGHRLGLARGTSSDYFWHTVAVIHGLDPASVEAVDVAVPRMAAAVAAGRVDAAVAWVPYDAEVMAAAGPAARRLETGGVFTTNWLLAVRQELLERRPTAVAGYLRALARAEVDVVRHPGRVAAVHARAAGLDATALGQGYEQLEFELGLTEQLVARLHQQATWQVRQRGLDPGAVPDFRDYLDTAPLMGLKPLAVRLLE